MDWEMDDSKDSDWLVGSLVLTFTLWTALVWSKCPDFCFLLNTISVEFDWADDCVVIMGWEIDVTVNFFVLGIFEFVFKGAGVLYSKVILSETRDSLVSWPSSKCFVSVSDGLVSIYSLKDVYIAFDVLVDADFDDILSLTGVLLKSAGVSLVFNEFSFSVISDNVVNSAWVCKLAEFGKKTVVYVKNTELDCVLKFLDSIVEEETEVKFVAANDKFLLDWVFNFSCVTIEDDNKVLFVWANDDWVLVCVINFPGVVVENDNNVLLAGTNVDRVVGWILEFVCVTVEDDNAVWFVGENDDIVLVWVLKFPSVIVEEVKTVVLVCAIKGWVLDCVLKLLGVVVEEDNKVIFDIKTDINDLDWLRNGPVVDGISSTEELCWE